MLFRSELQQRQYLFERHILPHDAKVVELGSGRSRLETFARLGIRPFRTVRQHSVADGINAVRMILPKCWFDAERCAKGIHALRHYRREWNESAQAWRASPVHDHASHGADAMRYLSLGVRDSDGTTPVEKPPADPIATGNWIEPSGRMPASWMRI